MESIHETPTGFCEFLGESYTRALHTAFLHAFHDYVMPFDLTEEQFRNHIVLNAVDLNSSLGWFAEGRIVGFTLNGFGEWNGVPTVYDAGTGVFPEFRRRGISIRMFEKMLPIFGGKGYQQCLLEVITTNDNAIALYNKLGFHVTRTLSLLHCTGKAAFGKDIPSEIEIREIDEVDWTHLRSFWDGEPSWQNSTEAIDRTRDKKCFTGAFLRGVCVGYIVYSANVGRIAQMAVDPIHRRKGIGIVLLQSMIARMSSTYTPQVINIDRSIESALMFFTDRGFSEKVSQFEMIRPI